VSAPPPEKKQSGLSLQTLVISSMAAATAAIVVPTFWERGSVLATAITPIIVAIVSEALKKPADVITSATPKVSRRSATGAAVRSEQPAGTGARGQGPEQVPPTRWGTEDDPFGLRQPERRPRRQFPWRIAIVTGLIAAVIGAGVVTASELAIFGNQVGDSQRRTGLFGGTTSNTGGDDAEETPTPTATEGATQTATPTETEEATPTPTATVSPTPTASVAPRQASPTPTPPSTQATPAPTGTP
jgi:hypothetical protein